ncbi:myelin protein zero-like protein 3 [Brachyhypopomus gauderio]|uniref:myelin protein zero-like protein 3 n=1 Tax=Brachyhypopomus gauderio TaxID=698409 RepID=UPI0040438238
MELRQRWKLPHGNGFWVRLFVILVLYLVPVCCIDITAQQDISAVKGQIITLSCTFSSANQITSSASVDWSFRPQNGGPSRSIFHFMSVAYPPEDEQFKGRVRWLGNLGGGDASIQLINATLGDNGTYTCAVRNPPDVHGLPAQTVLVVTPQKTGMHFSDVAVLLCFVLLPSGLIGLVLLARILCPCCPEKNSHLNNHSPIEVAHGEMNFPKQSAPMHSLCWECYLLDSDDEFELEKHQMKSMSESQC